MPLLPAIASSALCGASAIATVDAGTRVGVGAGVGVALALALALGDGVEALLATGSALEHPAKSNVATSGTLNSAITRRRWWGVRGSSNVMALLRRASLVRMCRQTNGLGETVCLPLLPESRRVAQQRTRSCSADAWNARPIASRLDASARAAIDVTIAIARSVDGSAAVLELLLRAQ
jgi:hypothetical protein